MKHPLRALLKRRVTSFEEWVRKDALAGSKSPDERAWIRTRCLLARQDLMRTIDLVEATPRLGPKLQRQLKEQPNVSGEEASKIQD